LDGQVFTKLAGETVDVGVGVLHRIGNEGTEELVFVEVQTGTYFGEDDIERIEDDYAR
jgi:mannose-6-phosphate isomerase